MANSWAVPDAGAEVTGVEGLLSTRARSSVADPKARAVKVPYGKGRPGAPCDECHEVPGRHCCLWNAEQEVDDHAE